MPGTDQWEDLTEAGDPDASMWGRVVPRIKTLIVAKTAGVMDGRAKTMENISWAIGYVKACNDILGMPEDIRNEIKKRQQEEA